MDINFTRRRFLETSAALLGVSLVGCGEKTPEGPTSRLNPDGTISLAGLKTLSNGTAQPFTFPDGEAGLVFVTAGGEAGAVSAKCTHAGCVVEWNAPNNPKIPLRCPCHESLFALDGKVLGGPATAPLKRYSVALSGAEAQLRAL